MTNCPLPSNQSRILLAQVLSFYMIRQDRHSADNFLQRIWSFARIPQGTTIAAALSGTLSACPRHLLNQQSKLVCCVCSTLGKRGAAIQRILRASIRVHILPYNGFRSNSRHSSRSIVFSEFSSFYPHSARYPREQSWRGQFRTCNSTVASREFARTL